MTESFFIDRDIAVLSAILLRVRQSRLILYRYAGSTELPFIRKYLRSVLRIASMAKKIIKMRS